MKPFNCQYSSYLKNTKVKIELHLNHRFIASRLAVKLLLFILSSHLILNIFFSNFSFAAIYSWEDCLRIASEKNAEINSARESIKAGEASEDMARSNFYPQISASLNRSESNTAPTANNAKTSYAAQININQNIFSGWSDSYKANSATLNRQITLLTLQAAKAKVSAALKQAYSNLFFAQQSLVLTDSFIKRREENLQMVDLRFRSGHENKGSVLLSEAYLDQSHYEKLQGLNARALSSIQILKLLDKSDSEIIELKTGLPSRIPPNEKELDLKSWATQHPDVASSLEQEKISDFEVSRARSAFWPSLDFTTSFGKIDSNFFPEADRWSAGLTLTWPLFNGFKDQDNISLTTSNWKIAHLNAHSVYLQTLNNLRQSYSNYSEAYRKYQVDEKFEKAALVRAEIARSKYNNGLMTFENWDIVENDLILRQKSLLASQRDKLLAESNWELAQGIGDLK